MSFFILSCDGGGIRGLVTALLLEQLEKDFGILKRVDLFAGTSTGGIIALALAGGVPLATISDIYQNQGARIFEPLRAGELEDLFARLKLAPRPNTANPQMHNVVEQVWENLGSLFYVKYNNTGLASVLKSVLPDQTLEGMRKVMVTTFQLDSAEGWRPLIINNLIDGQGADTKPIDAAISTGAAPTYFPPYKHPQYGYCIDGGVFANNPCSLALALAMEAGAQLGDITMLSIGTGVCMQRMEIVLPPIFHGPLVWLCPVAMSFAPATPLIEILLNGVGPADSFQCNQMLSGRFKRADVPLPVFIPLDDYQTVDTLREATDAYMQGPAWQEIRAWVSKVA
jgi:uncharacterized protein